MMSTLLLLRYTTTQAQLSPLSLRGR